VELKAVAAETTYTAGPLKVELVVCKRAGLVLAPRVLSGEQAALVKPHLPPSLQPLDPNSLINHVLKHSLTPNRTFAEPASDLGV